MCIIQTISVQLNVSMYVHEACFVGALFSFCFIFLRVGKTPMAINHVINEVAKQPTRKRQPFGETNAVIYI
jgi:hypothetical protein